MIFRSTILSIAFLIFLPTAFAKHFFTEVYQAESLWKVEHFVAEEYKLQEKVSERTFHYRYQALEYAKALPQSSKKSKFKFLVTEVADSSLWKVTNAWNQEWEDRYSDWVAKNLDEDFFVRNNFKTDCADVAYALRWIFARNHALPATGTLAGSGALISHEVMKSEWLKLPTHTEWQKDQRFVTALRWILDNVYTKTLYKDTYPVALRKETIRPGLINLTGVEGSHTEVFNKVSFEPEDTPLEVMSSTLPVMVRKLSRRIFMDHSPNDKKSGGLIHFRWPVLKDGKWTLIAKDQMPFFSLEQYEEDLCGDKQGLAKCMMEKLGIKFEPELIVKKVIAGHEAIIKERVEWVKSGHEYCQKHDCSPSTQGYEDYGTPSRDKRISDNFKNFADLASDLGKGELFTNWENETTLAELPIKLTMHDFRTKLSSGLVSYDPRDSIGARWALNSDYIREAATRKLEQAGLLRTELIKKASACREAPAQCQSSKTSFDELSTLEVDHERRKILVNWRTYCDESKCKVSDKFENEFFKVWGQSPAPWDSIEERLGNIPSYRKGHIIQATSTKYAFEDFLILDSKKLYSIKSREMVSLLEDVELMDYDPLLKVLFVLKAGSLYLYDGDLKLTGKIDITSSTPSTGLHSFQNGKVLLYECLEEYSCGSGSRKAWLIDLSLQQTAEEFSFKSIRLVYRSNESAFLISEDKYTFLKVSGPEVKITNIPNYKKTFTNYLVLSDETLLLSGSEENKYWAAFYSQEKWEPFADSDIYISISRINSSYVRITSYPRDTNSLNWVLDKDKNYWLSKGTAETGLSPGKDQVIVFRGKDNAQETFLFDGAEILPAKIPKKFNMVSAWPETYSGINNSGESAAYDYSGNLVTTFKNYLKSNCYSTIFYNLCSADSDELLVDFYINKNVPEIGESYYKIGVGSDFKIHQVYAYLLKKNEETAYYYNGSSGYSRDGKIIKLSRDYIMWFPN